MTTGVTEIVSRVAGPSHFRTWVRDFEVPDNRKAVWQVVNTFVPFVGLWILIFFSMGVSWWLVSLLAMLAGVLLLRIFVIFHDCGHGVFFSTLRANDLMGFLCGVLVLTPYRQWHRDHADHHAKAGNLDGRGPGEVWTMTVDEFLQAPDWKKRLYRLWRNPFFLFGCVPTLFFVFAQRLPMRTSSLRLKQSVWLMNAAVATQALLLMLVFGVVPYLFIQVIVIAVAGGAGFWMFYVQHQFESVCWERGDDWDYTAAALRGSSFYELPRVLQWCTGNIGFHHVHHFFPRIPNYHLEQCHLSLPLFKEVPVVTLAASLRTVKLKLWDESSRRLVRFCDLDGLTYQNGHQGDAVVLDDS
jgi:omega-6 fatty acid desaturase (delta-12 desaturase)